jgi:hypothetical protein
MLHKDSESVCLVGLDGLDEQTPYGVASLCGRKIQHHKAGIALSHLVFSKSS